MKGSGVRVPASASREGPASATHSRRAEVAAEREWGPDGVIWDPIESPRDRSRCFLWSTSRVRSRAKRAGVERRFRRLKPRGLGRRTSCRSDRQTRARVAPMELLPTLCFLGHQSAGPRLRLVRLPEESVEPSPVPLDGATCALDRGFARDGWLVFTPNEEVWRVPAALDGPAFRVGRWWDCVPSPNPRTVWVANAVDPDPNAGVDRHAPTVLVEYDGVLRQEVDRRELARSLRLEATVPDGWIL